MSSTDLLALVRISIRDLARNWSDDANTMSVADAIDQAVAAGYTLGKYADPTEGERVGLTGSEARAIAMEDPGLIWAAEGILALVRSSIADGRLAPELRRLVSSPAGAPDVTGWLHSSVLAAIEGEDDEQELIDGLHAIA